MRRLSAEALGRRRYREAAVTLADSLLKEEDALAAHSMCVSLGQLGDRQVLPALVSTLEHPDRSRAVSALEAIDRIAQESLAVSLGPLPEDLRERMEYAGRVRERLDLPPVGHPDTPR
jgi:HEAT repeat protein